MAFRTWHPELFLQAVSASAFDKGLHGQEAAETDWKMKMSRAKKIVDLAIIVGTS